MKSKISLNVNKTRENITTDLCENHVYFILIDRISPPPPPPKKPPPPPCPMVCLPCNPCPRPPPCRPLCIPRPIIRPCHPPCRIPAPPVTGPIDGPCIAAPPVMGPCHPPCMPQRPFLPGPLHPAPPIPAGRPVVVDHPLKGPPIFIGTIL